MSRNRVIYQSEALFVSQKLSKESCDTHTSEEIEQLHRVQSANYSFDTNNVSVNEFSELGSIGKIPLGVPTVDLEFSYYLSNFVNEESLGFHVSPNQDKNRDLKSCIINFIDDTKDEKNYFIKTTSEGNSAISKDGIESEVGDSVIGIGNASLTSYTVEASVGGIPTVSVQAKGSNIRFDSLDGSKNAIIPSLDRSTGVSKNQTYSLPLGLSDAGTEDALSIPVLKPGDIKISITKSLNNLYFTESDDLGRFNEVPEDEFNDYSVPGAKLPSSSSNVLDSAHIQSFNISFNLDRNSIEKLGNNKTSFNEIRYPVEINLEFEAILRDLTEGDLSEILNCQEYYDVKFELYSPSGCREDGSDHFPVCTYLVKNLKIDNQSFSSSIGENKSVSLSLSTQMGSLNQKYTGLFMRGITKNKTSTDTNEGPVITLLGNNPEKVLQKESFVDPGAIAEDLEGGSVEVIVEGSVDTQTVGIYELIYKAEDSDGNQAIPVTRKVEVVENKPPEIFINGSNPYYMTLDSPPFKDLDPGATVVDDIDGIIDLYIVDYDNLVNLTEGESYKVTYNATDSHGQSSSAERTVIIAELLPPDIRLNGGSYVRVLRGEPYIELGAVVEDKEDGTINLENPTNGSVDTSQKDFYVLEYEYTDTHNNTVNTSRLVEVYSDETPAIQLNGSYCTSILTGKEFQDPGVSVTDEEDNEAAKDIKVTKKVFFYKQNNLNVSEPNGVFSEVKTSKEGKHFILYTAEDSDGNKASVMRSVLVYGEYGECSEPIIRYKNSSFSNSSTVYIDHPCFPTDNLGSTLSGDFFERVYYEKSLEQTKSEIDISQNKIINVEYSEEGQSSFREAVLGEDYSYTNETFTFAKVGSFKINYTFFREDNSCCDEIPECYSIHAFFVELANHLNNENEYLNTLDIFLQSLPQDLDKETASPFRPSNGGGDIPEDDSGADSGTDSGTDSSDEDVTDNSNSYCRVEKTVTKNVYVQNPYEVKLELKGDNPYYIFTDVDEPEEEANRNLYSEEGALVSYRGGIPSSSENILITYYDSKNNVVEGTKIGEKLGNYKAVYKFICENETETSIERDIEVVDANLSVQNDGAYNEITNQYNGIFGQLAKLDEGKEYKEEELLTLWLTYDRPDSGGFGVEDAGSLTGNNTVVDIDIASVLLENGTWKGAGDYVITYTLEDSAGNKIIRKRKITMH